MVTAKSGDNVSRDMKYCRNYEGGCLNEGDLGQWVC